MRIIGLCGYAAAGKDSVADILVRHAGFRKLAFADALREEAAEGFAVEPLVFTRRETKDKPLAELTLRRAPAEFRMMVLTGVEAGFPLGAWLDEPRTPRQILQWWGTEYRRAQNTLYWVDQLAQRAGSLRDQGHTRIAVPDVRFDNEAAFIADVGGQLWQVRRPGIDAVSTTEGDHQSATDGSSFGPNRVLQNTGSLEDLRRQVLGAWWELESGLLIRSLELAS